MLNGKGMFIWQIHDCEKGQIDEIVRQAVAAKFSHVLIKIADGPDAYNVDPKTKTDLAAPLVEALQDAGLQVWGWHYVYSQDPLGEARIAARRVKDLGLDGYVIDAEVEYKLRTLAAERYLAELQKQLPAGVPVALSSYRYPSLHREFPWRIFLKVVDLVMPQVYWIKATNAGTQLRNTLREYRDLCRELGVELPLVPTGAAFHEHGWTARPAEIREFATTAFELGLTAYNFWEWGHARRYDLWDTVAKLDGGSVTQPQPPSLPQPAPGLNLRVTVPSLNMRSGPGIQYPDVGDLHQGDVLPVLDVSGQNVWVKVSDQPEQWACVQIAQFRYMEPYVKP